VIKVPDRGYYCGGAGCGGILLILAVCVLAASGFAYRHGPHWPYMLLHPRAPGVIVHHSATDARAGGGNVNAALLDEAHSRRGWEIRDSHNTYHIGYHFVILPDGTVERGRPEWLPGAHARGNNHYRGICLVGNFNRTLPTSRQMQSLLKLVRFLQSRYGIPKVRIYGHNTTPGARATDSPGKRFPMAKLKTMLER